jgi:hypothetical protein
MKEVQLRFENNGWIWKLVGDAAIAWQDGGVELHNMDGDKACEVGFANAETFGILIVVIAPGKSIPLRFQETGELQATHIQAETYTPPSDNKSTSVPFPPPQTATIPPGE